MESSVPTGSLKINQTVAIRRLSDVDKRYYHGMIVDIATEKNGGKLFTVIYQVYQGVTKPYKIQSSDMLCRVAHDDIDIQHDDYHNDYENDDGDDDGDDNYFNNSRSINSNKTRSSTRVQKGTITKKNDEIDSSDDNDNDNDNDVQMILDGNNKDHNLDNGINAKEYNSEPNIQVHDLQDRYFEERDWHERHGDISYLDESIVIDDKDDTPGDNYDNMEKHWHSEIKKKGVFSAPESFIENNPNALSSTRETYPARKKFVLSLGSYPKSPFSLTTDGMLLIDRNLLGFEISDDFISVITEEYKNITDPVQRGKTIKDPDDWDCDMRNGFRNGGKKKKEKRIRLNKLTLHYHNNTRLLKKRFYESCIHQVLKLEKTDPAFVSKAFAYLWLRVIIIKGLGMTRMDNEGEGDKKEFRFATEFEMKTEFEMEGNKTQFYRAPRWVHNDAMTMVLSRTISGMNEHKYNQQKQTPVHYPGIYLEAFPDRPIASLRRKNKTCLSDEGIYGNVLIKIQNQAQVIHNKKNIRATVDRNNGSPKKKRLKQCVTKSTAENLLDTNNEEGVIANSMVTVTLPTSVSVSNTQSITGVNVDNVDYNGMDLGHMLCVTCQVPIGNNFASRKAMYIDSEGTFCSEDIKAIAKRFNLDPQLALSNVAVIRVDDYSQLLNSISVAAATMEDNNNFVQLVINSSSKLYPENKRQEAIHHFSKILNKFQKLFKVSIVIVNPPS